MTDKNFHPIGPFSLPLVQGNRALDYSYIEHTILEASEQAERLFSIDLNDSYGLYVFSLAPPGSGRSYPYYVGKAVKQSLPDRALRNRDKKGFYDTILQQSGYLKARPQITLLPLITINGNPSRRGSNATLIDHAEAMLIGAARQANIDLWNTQHNTERGYQILGLTDIDRRKANQKRFADLFAV